MHVSKHWLARLGFSFLLVGGLIVSCRFDDKGQAGKGGGMANRIAPSDAGVGGLITGRDASTMPSGPCTGLRCQVTTCNLGPCAEPACPAGSVTTVSGTVYEPAGKVPLYNAKVFIPNGTLATIVDGANCEVCNATSGDPITEANTDANGHFVLNNAPVGAAIPLVVQIGKWRRQTTIPVTRCIENVLTDHELTRLPRNKSEGNIPKIALTTGGLDALECLLRKIGIADSEFTPETGDGRVNLYAGGKAGGTTITAGNTPSAGTDHYRADMNGGAPFTDAETWWESADNLKKYDIILHSCEGLQFPGSGTGVGDQRNKSAAALAAMQAYADAGGRIFASHWHNYWIERGPAPWPTVARFNHQGDPGANFVTTIDTTHTSGAALSQWLVNVGASTTPGQLVIQGGKRTVGAVQGATLRWAYNGTGQNAAVQYMSFQTPVGAGSTCGKVVFSDLHVTSGSGTAMEDDSDVSLAFPDGCRTTDLTPQEKALLFMLFDLSSCVVGVPG
jgi:hypothetical protein